MRVEGGLVAATVPRWSATAAGVGERPALVPPQHDQVVFPCDVGINDRFALWQGDISTLEVDAITNTTDESLTESNPVSDSIVRAAGPHMKEELVTRHECRPGDVTLTQGYNLPCRHVIHTVCPKYIPKYHTTAEEALHSCYSKVLYKAQEVGARSLALCVLNTSRRNFPPELAAHVALRTIRRFLEQNKMPRLVIFCVDSCVSLALLSSIAPLYFPRAPLEADLARWRLGDIGGENGEPTHPERRIRIIHNPHSNSDSTEDDTSLYDDEAAVEAAVAFAKACAPDTQRLLAEPSTPYQDTVQPYDPHQQYERLLRRAHNEDLSEVSGIGCLYQSGVDRLGRPVVVFIGKWFPIGEINLDKALLYLIKLLDPIVSGDYVIAYFHTLASSGNHPPFSWLKEVYTVLPYKYKKNLKAFYIVHPTFWTKMMTWWFTTFMAPAIKAKVHNLPGVEYLYSVMPRQQLEVPAFVTEYDMTINGLHYFQPDTNNT